MKGVIEMGERICPYCGAHLDPQERCECQEEEQNNSTQNFAERGCYQ